MLAKKKHNPESLIKTICTDEPLSPAMKAFRLCHLQNNDIDVFGRYKQGLKNEANGMFCKLCHFVSAYFNPDKISFVFPVKL